MELEKAIEQIHYSFVILFVNLPPKSKSSSLIIKSL